MSLADFWSCMWWRASSCHPKGTQPSWRLTKQMLVQQVSNGDTIDVNLYEALELQRPADIAADDEYYRCMASGVNIDVSPDSRFAFLALPHRYTY